MVQTAVLWFVRLNFWLTFAPWSRLMVLTDSSALKGKRKQHHFYETELK